MIIIIAYKAKKIKKSGNLRADKSQAIPLTVEIARYRPTY